MEAGIAVRGEAPEYLIALRERHREAYREYLGAVGKGSCRKRAQLSAHAREKLTVLRSVQEALERARLAMW